MNTTLATHLFQRHGVELEYMLVDQATLDVWPQADRLFHAVTGSNEGEYAPGPVAWSNELVAHVLELKVAQPVPDLAGQAEVFAEQVRAVNARLATWGARLLPTAMHPWMQPQRETRLWPHDSHEIYELFDTLFDCRGHGWANLQSAHLNLPFAGDDEFGRLHAAVRLVLPLLPALAASSPLCEGRYSGWLDTRLDAYRHNARRLPRVAGSVVPEQVFTEADYHREVFSPLLAEVAPHDPQSLFEAEWLNARGAIARFSRGTIEIRLLDVQECPQADLAILAATTAVVQALVEERFASTVAQQAWPVATLADLLWAAARDGQRAVVRDQQLLAHWGCAGQGSLSLAEVWTALVEQVASGDPAHRWWQPPVETILRQGCLAQRIVAAVGPHPRSETLREVYATLADCLAHNQLFSV